MSSVLRILTDNEIERGDARVLKAQLDLAVQSVRTTRVTSPLWAVALAILCSDVIGFVGHRPLIQTLCLPLIIMAAGVVAAAMTAVYERDMTRDPDHGLGSWYRRHCAMQLAVSAAWGTMPWLLWSGGDAVNHIFVATCAIAVVSVLVLSRGSNMTMFLCALVPISLMTTARFATGDFLLDYVIAFAAPLFGL